MLVFSENVFWNILWYVLISIGVIVFIILFFVSAGYGRYNSKKWGPQIDNTLGWVIMECIPPIKHIFLWDLLSSILTVITGGS